MSNGMVMGYSGGVSLSKKIPYNPIAAQPSAKITLHANEVNAVTAQLGLPAFGTLNPGQRKMVAARALNARGTPQASAQAGQVLLSNPAYQTFTIISGIAAL